jgi:hypothetical protein
MAQENIAWDSPKPQENIVWDQPKTETAYDRFLTSLRNPQTGGKSGVVGPMLVGGTGELIKGAGALTQLAGFPNAGNRLVEVGGAMTEGAKSVAPVSGTVGQIGSYVLPFGAAQRTLNTVAQVPQVAKTLNGSTSHYWWCYWVRFNT